MESKMSNGISQLHFNKEYSPDVLNIANELADLEQRKPHDSIRLLILEAGKNKIESLRNESSSVSVNLNTEPEEVK